VTKVPTDLERSILHTACWFAIFGYPLTAFEVWKWLWFPVSPYPLIDVRRALRESVWLSTRLETDGCFYALRGQQAISTLVFQREERFVYALRKFAKLQEAANYFSRIPTVRAVAAANTLAWWHARSESDIDLFIVTEPGTIWLTRFFAVIPFLLLGHRPGKTKSDPLCFSFFIASDRPELASLQLFGGDPYLAYWVRSLVPIMERSPFFLSFHKANAWVEEMLPHADPRLAHRRLARIGTPQKERGNSRLLLFLEGLAERVQRWYLPAALRARANRDSSVLITPHMLKFHEHDRRAEYRDRFQAFITLYDRS